MPGTRLVLIMGGGVSLGTYLAGALTEIFWALRHVNGDRSVGPRKDVQVEVLAGASAGAMSAALFARALTADPQGIRALHQAWVREISIRALLEKGKGGVDPVALFSTGKIDELAGRFITPPADYRDWQPFCAAPLRIGFTLTNLGGVRYRIEYANHAKSFFTTRIHNDSVRFELSDRPGTDGARDVVWNTMRRAAVASGAFPAAFPPRSIERRQAEYSPAAFDPTVPDPVPMWYVDGGVLDNEPIGLAKDLVERNPDHHRLDYRYILIDPYLDTPLHGLNDGRFAGPTSLPGVLTALAGAVIGQSNAKDWLRVNKTNWRLTTHAEFVNRQLRPLFDAVRNGTGDGDAANLLATGLKTQARAIAAFKRGVNKETAPAEAEVDAYLASNLDRIAADPRYAPALEGLGDARDAMLAAIFIVESAAGLRDKEPMDLYLIAPQGDEEHPLAGDFLKNFGGFFREEWREHDFLCGRRDARQVLRRDLLEKNDDGSPGEPIFDYPEEPGVNYDPEPLSLGPEDLTADERKLFRKHLEGRFEPIVAPYVPWYLRPFRGRIVGKAAEMALKKIGFPG